MNFQTDYNELFNTRNFNFVSEANKILMKSNMNDIIKMSLYVYHKIQRCL